MPQPNGVAQFEVKLSKAATAPVTVHYRTVDDTAHAGVDYTAVSGNLVFQPGDISEIVSVQLFGTPGETGQMRFLLALDTPQNALLGSASATALLVHDPVAGSGGPTLPPPAGSGSGSGAGAGDGAVSLLINDNWGSGYTSTVSVKNIGTDSEYGWQVLLETADEIVSLWSGTILSHTGNSYVIGNAAWNGELAGGNSVSFGFQASHTDPSATVSAALLKMGV